MSIPEEDVSMEDIVRRVDGRHPLDLPVARVPAYYKVQKTPLISAEQELFERVVNAAWMSHLRGYGVNPPEIQAQDAELPIAAIARVIRTPLFKQAARTRGIPAADLNYLTNEMMMLLQVLGDHSLSLTTRQRVKSVGVDWQQYQGWLQYTPFRNAHREIMRRTLAVATEAGDRMLAERIEAGDIKALEYANEMTGRFVRGNEVQSSVGKVMGMVLSILKRHVTDPKLLMDISAEMMQLASSNGITPPPNEITATVIEEDPQHDEDTYTSSGNVVAGTGLERAAQSGDRQREPDAAGHGSWQPKVDEHGEQWSVGDARDGQNVPDSSGISGSAGDPSGSSNSPG
jgi:hypothetical protein